MKQTVLFALATMVMASCSSDGLVNNSSSGEAGSEAPIAFSVEKRNITRTGETPTTTPKNLEATGHYNFGVWAYKYKEGLTTQQVMGNYLVGYSNGSNKGYDKTNATTWKESTNSVEDHVSPWFYEYLGKNEYNYDGDAGFYKASQNAYMSANANQYLRYWDLAYTNTNFYAYAPYRSTGVTFDESTKIVTVAHGAQTAGYDDASLNEFMYAGATATNSDKKDVLLTFKHLGAQVNLRFYESVRGYRVEIIDVTSSAKGIQATPTVKSGNTYSEDATYYTSCGATIDYTTVTSPSATVNFPSDAQTTHNNLIFEIPNKGLESFKVLVTKVSYNVIPDSIKSEDQKYAESPTIYYPVAQPENSEVGFTFHVSYKLIAEDNGEEITVNDARVYVPAYIMNGTKKEYIAAWQPNTKYTYTFKITKNSTGTTKPDDTYINPTSPEVPATPQVYPIVFDGATIEDYTSNVEQSY